MVVSSAMLLLSIWSPSVHADVVPTEWGVGIGARGEPADAIGGDSDLRFSAGPVLSVPVRWLIAPGVLWRADAVLALNPGQDRVEWYRLGGGIQVYSDDHWTLLSSASVSLGPELVLVDRARSRWMWGVHGGVAGVHSWHSFESEAADLFDLDANDLDDPTNIDPYSFQAAPLVGTQVNLTLWSTSGLALGLEAGYNVSYLREVSLQKADPNVGAVRAAMGLNFFHLGMSIIWEREERGIQ